MRRGLVAIWVASVLVANMNLGRAADLAKPTGDSIVPPDAKLEHLFTRSAKIEGGLTEGPAVAPDGSIYFSDIPMGSDKGMILRFDPKTKKTTVFAEDSHKSNGLICNSEGQLLAAEGADFGGRGVARWDLKTGQRTVIVDRFQGKKFNAPNDICVDRIGRIYFTDPKYVGPEPRELEHRSVYRSDRDGSVIEITHDVGKPNGIAISKQSTKIRRASRPINDASSHRNTEQTRSCFNITRPASFSTTRRCTPASAASSQVL